MTIGSNRLARLAVVPIPVLVLLAVGLWQADLHVAWRSPLLNLLVHYCSSILGVALILIPTGRFFLATGEFIILLFGCGTATIIMGLGAATVSFNSSLDRSFALYNLSALLSSLFHVVGAASIAWPKTDTHRARWLSIGYAASVAFMGLVGWCAIGNRLPIFYVEGQGGSPLRTLVLSSAAALFLLTSGLLWRANRHAASPFRYWYALGLVLVAAGLTASMAITVINSPLQWASRITQFVGLIYLCIAITSLPESDAQMLGLESIVENGGRNRLLSRLRRHPVLRETLRYGFAAFSVAAAFGFRQALTAWFGPGHSTYACFYPAIMAVALLAGFGPGITATIITCLVVDYTVLPPVGQFFLQSPADRLGMLLFGMNGLLLNVTAEVYRKNRGKAAAYDHERALRDKRIKLAIFAEMTFEGIVESEAGRIVDCNEQFARMTGYSVTELKGMELDRLIPSENLCPVAVDGRLRRESVYEYRMIRKDGSCINVEARGRAVYLDRSVMYTAIRDITEHRRTEEALRAGEERLRSHLDQLDVLVRQRTAELTEKNEQLRAEIAERKSAEDIIRKYSHRLVNMEEELRKKLSGELHDHISQQLAALSLNLSFVSKRIGEQIDEENRLKLEDMKQLAREINYTIREMMNELRPPLLDDYGLTTALRWHAQIYSKRIGVAVKLYEESDFPRLSSKKEIALFRIFQESLTNIVKHAEATYVDVILSRNDGSIGLSITDNGRGFEFASSHTPKLDSGWGLTLIRENAASIGGEFFIDSEPGHGTTVSVKLPEQEGQRG